MQGVHAEKGESGPNWFKWGVIGIGTVSVLLCLYWGLVWFKQSGQEAAPPTSALQAPAPTATAPASDAAPAHPLAQPEPATALTPANGDAALLAELSRLSGVGSLSRLIRPANLVRHIVATVDALPRRRVPPQVLPTMPVPGTLTVVPAEGGNVIGEANGRRYLPWVHLLVSIDPSSAAATYRRFYPLLQQAYRDLGYPKGYFNDRLIEAIDDVLQTPQVSAPLRVEVPAVMWHYVDPDLESLSAGQKVLLRMGRSNEKAIRDWLVAFRANIA